jgi:hypothetical protein
MKKKERVGHVGRLYCDVSIYLLLLLDIYIHPQQRSHPGLGDWDNRERADFVSTLSRNRLGQLCVCNFWFVHFTYIKRAGPSSFQLSRILFLKSLEHFVTRLDENRRGEKKRGKNILEITNVLHLADFIFCCCWCCFLFCCAVSFFLCATMSSSCLMMEDVGDDSVTPAALPSLFSHSSLFFYFLVVSFWMHISSSRCL